MREPKHLVDLEVEALASDSRLKAFPSDLVPVAVETMKMRTNLTRTTTPMKILLLSTCASRLYNFSILIL
jgi:hypothetical protein